MYLHGNGKKDTYFFMQADLNLHFSQLIWCFFCPMLSFLLRASGDSAKLVHAHPMLELGIILLTHCQHYGNM